MTEHDASPQVELLTPQGPSAKQIAKEVLKGISGIPHGEAISSLEYLAQLRGTIFSTTEGVVLASVTWQISNRTVYLPAIVRETFVVKQMRLVNGAVVSGNVDLGVFDTDEERLPRTKLVSTGSTAQSGTNSVQLFDVSSITLVPGFYYLACSFDNTTATTHAVLTSAQNNGFDADELSIMDGAYGQNSTFPLASTAAAALPNGNAPLMYAARHQF